MKIGRTLTELATEIERQRETKRDYIAQTDALAMAYGKDDVTLFIGDQSSSLPIRPIAHGQIAQHTGIPKPYYDRCLHEAPRLLASNVDQWFQKYPAPRMLRTLDGNVRAFLSDRYRPLENFEFAEAVLPVLQDLNLEIMSCEITERRLYIKAVDQRIKQDVPSGKMMGDASHSFFDTCSPAIIISNSEVGCGRLSIEHGVFTKVCTNLMAIAGAGMKKTHLGAKHELTEDFEHMLADDTRQATDKAVWLQARDVVRAAFHEAKFEALAKSIGDLSTRPINGDPVKVVELSARRFGITQDESKSVLRHLIQGGDLTQYGLLSAVTRTAQDLTNYDRASEFEQLGGRILELPANDWREISAAA